MITASCSTEVTIEMRVTLWTDKDDRNARADSLKATRIELVIVQDDGYLIVEFEKA